MSNNILCPYCPVSNGGTYDPCNHALRIMHQVDANDFWFHPKLLNFLKEAYLFQEIEAKLHHSTINVLSQDNEYYGYFVYDRDDYLKKFKYAYDMKYNWGIEIDFD